MKFKINQIIDNTAGTINAERGIIIAVDKKNRKYKIESLDRYNNKTNAFFVYYQYETELKSAYVVTTL